MKTIGTIYALVTGIKVYDKYVVLLHLTLSISITVYTTKNLTMSKH